MQEPLIEMMPLATLNPSPYNPRKISADAMAGLETSLDRFGVVQPIIVNRRSGYVVGGHQRLKALRKKKIKATPVVIVDLDETDEKALNVALNSQLISGEFTADLQGILEQIQLADEALFRSLLLDGLLADGATQPPPGDPDAVPEPPLEAVTQLGDLYVLDKHRLVCGDATNPETYVRLLGDEPVHMTFTSPPYNAGKSEALSGNTHMDDNKYGEGHDDDKSEADYLGLLSGVSSEVLQRSDCFCVNIQMLAGNKVAFVGWLNEFRDHLIDVAIWKKNNGTPALAQNVLNAAFEFLVFLSGKKNPSRRLPGPKFRGNVSNVYDGPPQRENEFCKLHAATFPVHLPKWIVANFTRKSDTIMDCFAGTGTTLIACEELGRKARMVELDPIYCDVIVQRWQNYTGKTAERLSP